MAVTTETREGLGEVRIETGTGIVTLPDHDPQARNARVEIKATHTDLRYPIKAWVDTRSGQLWRAVTEAAETRAEVEYRIEIRRGRGVDPEVPLEELEAKQKIRDLVIIRPAGSGGQESSQEPPSEPRDPQADLGGVRTSPPASGAERARELVSQASHGEVRTSTGPGARMSTWAYMDTLAVASLAWERVLSQGQGPDAGRARSLAKVLLRAADQAQIRTFGRIDRADQSRPRTRGALRTALEAYPVPWGADGHGRVAWEANLLDTVVELLELGLELLDDAGG